jgi:hypothetical protein
MVTKCEEFGENVMDEAIDLVFLNWYRSVADLYCHNPGTEGRPQGSEGSQYSTNPSSSAETTQSYFAV